MTPGSQLGLEDRARLYRALAQLQQAGVPGAAIADTLGRGFRSAGAGRFAARYRATVTSGNPLSAAMLESRDIGIPVIHATIVAAAEKSGDAPKALLRLAERDDARERQRRDLLKRAAYPVLLFHFGVFGPSIAVFMQSPVAATITALLTVLPVDLVLFCLYQAAVGGATKPWADRLAGRIPLLAGTVTDHEGAAYLSALGQLYEAGVPILDAAAIALDAVSDADRGGQYRRAVEASRDDTFAGLIARLPIASRPEVLGLLLTAEPAGELGRALRDAADLLESRAAEGRTRLVSRAGAVLYVLAAAFVAWRVFSFYLDYFERITSMR